MPRSAMNHELANSRQTLWRTCVVLLTMLTVPAPTTVDVVTDWNLVVELPSGLGAAAGDQVRELGLNHHQAPGCPVCCNP